MALVADINSSVMNSYVTVEEADAYFADRGHGDAWATVTTKEAMLISATNQIDWFMTFKGTKVATSQPLEWPRYDVLDDNTLEYLPSTEIPKRLKTAVLEMAFSSIDEDRMADDDMAGLQEVKIGSLKVVSNMVGPWQQQKRKVPVHIYKILGGLIENSSSMFKRVVRC